MKANNVYDSTPVTRSDAGIKRKNQENPKDKFAISKGYPTDHSAEERDKLPQAPIPNQKHSGFQRGTNPMNESSFEKTLIEKEKKDRDMAKERYVMGIQGVDGGKKPYETRNIPN